VFYRSWPRGERAIAAYLKVHPSVIWPSRYPAEQKAVTQPALQPHTPPD